MTFADKLKKMRKQAGMSQEKLAEKLNVSRQAITKWETEMGIPDVENIMAISTLFGVSMDELLSNEKGAVRADYLFESVTEYDVDGPKRYDMKLGGAKHLVLSGYEGEKIRIHLASNTLTSLQNDLKVKIDDVKSRMDIEVIRKNGITEAAAKEAVMIFAQLPAKYIGKVELTVNAETIELRSLTCDALEIDAKTTNVALEDVAGTVEINCNLDMNVVCYSLKGELNINQISAASKISIPEGTTFATVTKGMGNAILFEKDGKPVDAFDSADAENIIELNGMKSELLVTTFKKGETAQ